MNIPKFNAESALHKSTRIYRGSPRFGRFAQSEVPAPVQPSQLEVEGLDEAELEADAGGGDEEGTDGGSDEVEEGEDASEAFEENGEDVDEG